ncbi:sensor domain-containing protein [Nonomuraea sp. NN258]|uniref:sensor domain-containing protein n=1 Tax=Nonomuraea antri TaxID=2730852 RepID=UPI001569094D|nr:sensor domain-containing protein [Nonomuraea antri]NRQ40635.1 sensor domain-containing protein [Nonomuraea antri]
MTSLARRLSRDTRYVLLGFPLAVIAFCLVVAGVAAGVGSAVAFVGLLILAGTAAAARNFADLERAALPGILGHPVARPPYGEAPEGASWFRRTMTPVASAQAWVDLLYAIIAFPIALASFVFTVVWWAVAIAGLAFPVYGWFIASIPGTLDHGLPALLGLPQDVVTFVALNTVVGVLFAVTLLPVVRGAALIKATVAQVLLTRADYSQSPDRRRPMVSTYAAMR